MFSLSQIRGSSFDRILDDTVPNQLLDALVSFAVSFAYNVLSLSFTDLTRGSRRKEPSRSSFAFKVVARTCVVALNTLIANLNDSIYSFVRRMSPSADWTCFSYTWTRHDSYRLVINKQDS